MLTQRVPQGGQMRTFHFFDVRDLLKLFQQKNPSILLIPGTSFYEASLPILNIIYQLGTQGLLRRATLEQLA